jgi:hypothetical protein
MKESPVETFAAEMTPLNADMAGFELDGVTIEELERRFEMALTISTDGGNTCRCPGLQSCGVYCSPPLSPLS